MATIPGSNDMTSAFINAKPFQGRLVRERAESTPAKPRSESTKVQLKTDTSSSFAIGLDDPEAPKALSVEIEFRVAMRDQDSGQLFLDYEAKHEMQFTVLTWGGFSDWTNLPSEAITPYIAMIHDIALRKAEATMHEMGIRGGTLPRPESFDSPLESAPTSAVAA